MNVMINRLDPNVPDPVESRRRAAGRLVRIAYATAVFGVLAFFVVYFGRPLVYLGGPGIVSSHRYMVSLPYIVQVHQMNVTRGAAVKSGQEIAQVRSPEVDNIIATYMRALADVASRSAELRLKVLVAEQSLETARSYLTLTQEAVQRIEATSAATITYRVEIYRERAAARKAVVTFEAEFAGATAQLVSLDALNQQVREHVDEVERHFAKGRVVAPIDGIISTNLARIGQSLVAGTPIAEILDASDIFVDWYIPNERLAAPTIGNQVLVVFGNLRLPGKIAEILPISDVYAGTHPLSGQVRTATQIARIRFDPGAQPPALNSTVYVHMHYTRFTARMADILIWLFGLDQA